MKKGENTSSILIFIFHTFTPTTMTGFAYIWRVSLQTLSLKRCFHIPSLEKINLRFRQTLAEAGQKVLLFNQGIVRDCGYMVFIAEQTKPSTPGASLI